MQQAAGEASVNAVGEVGPSWRIGSRPSRVGLAALAVGVGGVVLRLVLILTGTPPTNSDEATMGLAALHIAGGTDHPVWFYGQAYMGTLEAYLAAPLVGLFGTGVPVLRVVALLFFAAFLLLAYRLTVALFTPGLALFTVALLSLGADRVLKNELIVAGGYPEILPAAALLMLLAVRLSGVPGPDPAAPPRPRPWRLCAFGAWGLVAGLCVWTDWLVLPYVGVAGLLLVVCRGRELRGLPGVVLAAGALLGAAPLIAYNVTAAPGADSLSVYSRLSSAGNASLAAHLHGGVLLGIPLASGLCAPSHCAPAVMAWGWVYPVLLVAAAVLAVIGARRAHGAARQRELGRLALLVAAAATLVAYLGSSGSAETPIESARYLHPLLLSLPAVLWPLWRPAVAAGRPVRWSRPAAAAALTVLLVTAAAATVALIGAAPGYGRQRTRQAALIAELDRLGADRVYSEYWTCGRITFATRERVVCAVLDDQLRPGFDRYAPYRTTVRRADKPAYVFPVGTPADGAFVQRASATGTSYTAFEAGGYHIYRADRPLPG
jgi:hypothetical protein